MIEFNSFKTFEDIQGLNGIITQRGVVVYAVAFDRKNYAEVLDKASSVTGVNANTQQGVYVISSLAPQSIPSRKGGANLSNSRLFYIGKSNAQRGVRGRLDAHCKRKDPALWWEVGVALFSTQDDGFTGDEVSTLEYRLTEPFKEDDRVVSDKKNTSNRGSDITRYVDFIWAVLNLLDLHVNASKLAPVTPASTKPISAPVVNKPEKSKLPTIEIDVIKDADKDYKYLTFTELRIGGDARPIPKGTAQEAIEVLLQWIAANLGSEQLENAIEDVPAVKRTTDRPGRNYRGMNVNGTTLWFMNSSASTIIHYVGKVAKNDGVSLPKPVKLVAQAKPLSKK